MASALDVFDFNDEEPEVAAVEQATAPEPPAEVEKPKRAKRSKAKEAKEAEPPPPADASPSLLDDAAEEPDAGEFDPANIGLPVGYEDGATNGELKVLQFRNTGKQEWFRVHPDVDVSGLLLEDEDERTIYLVHPDLSQELEDEAKPARLYFCCNKQGGYFWTHVNINVSGRPNSWLDSNREAMELAKTTWIRKRSSQRDQEYKVSTLQHEMRDPIWPNKSVSSLLALAFRDRFIKSVTHPLVRKLKGLA